MELFGENMRIVVEHWRKTGENHGQNVVKPHKLSLEFTVSFFNLKIYIERIFSMFQISLKSNEDKNQNEAKDRSLKRENKILYIS